MRIGALTRTAAVVLAAVVVLLAPSDALAARSVPKGFFGMNWDQEVTYRTSLATRSIQWGKMAASGAESARAIFWWRDAQPKKDGPTDYRATDALVTLAAEHGLELIPVVIAAPRWARSNDKPFSPPNRGAYAKYLVKLVERYGVDGKFWKKHTSIPKRPIRALQIWNEPTLQYQWTIPSGKDWAVGYGKLLCKSHSAVKDADHRVRVLMAGLPNASFDDLDHLYAKGHVHGCFDVGAIHPYTAKKGGVLTLVKRYRAVMKKHGDADKKLWVTELGLPASKGQTSDTSSLQTDDAGMAQFLKDSYNDLMNNRQKLRVDHVFFYTWASVYKGWIFKWTGLFRYDRDHKQDLFEEKPAYQTYVDLAQSAEGCTKTTTGACAR